MNRTIIFYENHFTDFYQQQDQKVKEKIKYVLELIRQVDRVPEKFLTHLTGSAGLDEIRVEYQSNIYRVFCCFHTGQLVVLFNALQQKTQKTPKKEIDKAVQLMSAYFKSKNNSYGKI